MSDTRATVVTWEMRPTGSPFTPPQPLPTAQWLRLAISIGGRAQPLPPTIREEEHDPPLLPAGGTCV
eukprot:COSAG01_NODE_9224_length_2514_cov_1.278675_3_plen_66_part_01